MSLRNYRRNHGDCICHENPTSFENDIPDKKDSSVARTCSFERDMSDAVPALRKIQF